jgi:hypothetical protein
VSIVENADPSRGDEIREIVQTKILPAAREMKGLQRALTLVDPAERRVLAITFWDSEEDANAAEPRMQELNQNIPDAGQRIASVGIYRIMLDEDMSS